MRVAIVGGCRCLIGGIPLFWESDIHKKYTHTVNDAIFTNAYGNQRDLVFGEL